MYDLNNLYELSQERQRDLLADAEAYQKVKQSKQAKRPSARKLPGRFLRLLLTTAR